MLRCMSNFKLDFDISSHRRPAPRKTCTSASAAVTPENRSANQTVAEKETELPASPKTTCKETKPVDTLAKVPAKVASIYSAFSFPKGTKFIFALILAFAAFTYLVSNLYVFQAQTKHRVTISRCNTHNNAVTCQSACKLRGDCKAPQIVSFETMQCADGVHSVLLHNAGEEARRLPAFYLRVPNTSMFEFTGDRGTFRPASCQAEMRNVVLRNAPLPVEWALSGYLWWVSGESVVSFDVVRGSKVIAELDASVVLQRCYSSTHCVFKLPMECRIAEEAHVFGRTSSGQKKAETFVFC